MAEMQLGNLRNALTGGFVLQTSANPGRDQGGSCYGDSGGPVFLGKTTSNLIVSVTSFGLSPWCTGVDFSYRVDTQATIDWILATVPASEVGDIEIVDPPTEAVAAAPAAGEKAKAKHKKHGKVKGEKRRGGKAMGQRRH